MSMVYSNSTAAKGTNTAATQTGMMPGLLFITGIAVAGYVYVAGKSLNKLEAVSK